MIGVRSKVQAQVQPCQTASASSLVSRTDYSQATKLKLHHFLRCIQTISDASCYMLSRSASKAIRSTRPTGLCREQALICPGSKNNSAGFSVSQSTNARCSSSSTRWKSRQGRDSFARDAKVQGLKSRAAFKLLEVRETETEARRKDLADWSRLIPSTEYSSLDKLS